MDSNPRSLSGSLQYRGLGEGCVGHLVHADDAQGGLIDQVRNPSQAAPPIGSCYPIARHEVPPVAEKINPSVNQVTCGVDDTAQLWRHTLNERR